MEVIDDRKNKTEIPDLFKDLRSLVEQHAHELENHKDRSLMIVSTVDDASMLISKGNVSNMVSTLAQSMNNNVQTKQMMFNTIAFYLSLVGIHDTLALFENIIRMNCDDKEFAKLFSQMMNILVYAYNEAHNNEN